MDTVLNALKKITVLFLLLFPVLAIANPDEEVFVHAHLNFSPYVNPDSTGIAIDVAKMVYERAGVKVKFEYYPWSRVQKMVQGGRVLFATYGAGPEEARSTTHFTTGSENFVPLFLTVFSTSDDIPLGMEGYAGKSVIVIRNWVLGPLEALKTPELGVKFNTTNRLASGISMLKIKRADYLIGYLEPVVAYLESNAGKVPKLYQKVLAPIEGYPVVLSRKHPKYEEYLPKITKAYAELFEEKILNPKTGIPFGYDFSEMFGLDEPEDSES